jgi:hypothetical protein
MDVDLYVYDLSKASSPFTLIGRSLTKWSNRGLREW